MGSGTVLGTILQSANSLDILLYIRDHPGCRKSEIYQNVTRNAHTPEKIASMASMGLIEVTGTQRGNVTLMSLTDRGMRLTDHLLAAESVLRETLPQEQSGED